MPICRLEMMPSWCRQVNWGNCGIPLVNCAVLCVKDDWKGRFWGQVHCLSKLRSLLRFPSGITSHSKIAQFNWECIGRFRFPMWTLFYEIYLVSYLVCSFVCWKTHHLSHEFGEKAYKITLLNIWSTILVKMTVAYPVRKFPALFRTRRKFTDYTISRYIQCMPYFLHP